MAIVFQFAIGLIFGLGLLLSGMSDPAKVLNFLDLAGIASGTWDPSLAFVMAGAIAVTFGASHFWCGLGAGGLLPWPRLHGARLRLIRGRHLCCRDDGRHAGRALVCQSPLAVAHRRTGGSI